MEKRFTISGCSTCLGIAGAILLIAAALLCGCTGTEDQKMTDQDIVAISTHDSGAKDGDIVLVDYVGTFDDGTEFDNSSNHGIESGPVNFTLGSGRAISGFDKALHGMKIGESKKFTLTPDEAYGEYNESLIIEYPVEIAEKGTEKGDTVEIFYDGYKFPAVVHSIDETNITLDMNRPLAGKNLTFYVVVRNIFIGDKS